MEETMTSPAFKIIALALLTLVGCTVVQVNQDYDPDAKFGRLTTWQWRDATQPATGDVRVDNLLLDKRIRRAVERHLAARHIRRVTADPDFYLAYHFAVQQKIKSESYNTTMGWGGYYYPWYGGFGTETRIYQYDESRLTIDVIDADSGSLLWRGTGIYRFRDYKTPELAAEKMQQTVDKILAQFPPA
jgi:hypothetical protein